MDWGLAALCLIAVAAAMLSMHNAASMRGELRTLDLLRVDVQAAKEKAAQAVDTAQKIDTDQYQDLRRKIIDLGEDLKSQKAESARLQTSINSVSGHIGKIKQQLAEPRETPEEPDPLLLPPDAAVHLNLNNHGLPKTFGKVAR